MKRGRYWCLLLIVMVGFFSMRVFAAGSINKGQEVSLTICYRSGEHPLSGAGFSLFRVADVDASGELTVTKEFEDYAVLIRGEDDDAWKTQAVTLEGYVLRNQWSPFASGKTDSNGMLTFSTEKHHLTPGLYLVTGERHRQGKWRYDAAPYFVLLPGVDEKTNEWIYAVEASVKYEASRIPEREDEEDTIDRRVLKVWKDDGYEAVRPNEIEVQLLQNGKVYDLIRLNEENNWSYQWYDLDAEDRWSIVEKEVKGYAASISRSGTTFVLTNTYVPEKTDEPESPTKSDHSPGNPSSETGTSGSSKLPQTGQLWWPVPILICMGLLCFVIGVLKERVEE